MKGIQPYALRFLALTQKEFANGTFSVLLRTTTNSTLVEATPENGVSFSYKVPDGVCVTDANKAGSNRLPLSAAVAIMDELSTYSFMIKGECMGCLHRIIR